MGDFLGIGHAVKHGYNDVTHEVSHTGDQIEHVISGGLMQIEHATTNGVNAVKQEGDKALHSVRSALPELESVAEQTVSKVFVPVVSELMKPIERIVFTVGKDMLEELHDVAKATIGRDDKLINDFNSINFYVASAGTVAIGMYFKRMWDRGPRVISVLRRYEKGIPATRVEIMNFIQAIGPDALDVTITGKLPIVDIGGSIGAWSIPASLFEHLLDDVLKKAGIPE